LAILIVFIIIVQVSVCYKNAPLKSTPDQRLQILTFIQFINKRKSSDPCLVFVWLNQ